MSSIQFSAERVDQEQVFSNKSLFLHLSKAIKSAIFLEDKY